MYHDRQYRYLTCCGFRSAFTSPGQVVDYGFLNRSPTEHLPGLNRLNVSLRQSPTLHRIFDICQHQPDRLQSWDGHQPPLRTVKFYVLFQFITANAVDLSL